MQLVNRAATLAFGVETARACGRDGDGGGSPLAIASPAKDPRAIEKIWEQTAASQQLVAASKASVSGGAGR